MCVKLIAARTSGAVESYRPEVSRSIVSLHYFNVEGTVFLFVLPCEEFCHVATKDSLIAGISARMGVLETINTATLLLSSLKSRPREQMGGKIFHCCLFMSSFPRGYVFVSFRVVSETCRKRISCRSLIASGRDMVRVEVLQETLPLRCFVRSWRLLALHPAVLKRRVVIHNECLPRTCSVFHTHQQTTANHVVHSRTVMEGSTFVQNFFAVAPITTPSLDACSLDCRWSCTAAWRVFWGLSLGKGLLPGAVWSLAETSRSTSVAEWKRPDRYRLPFISKTAAQNRNPHFTFVSTIRVAYFLSGACATCCATWFSHGRGAVP